MPITLNGTSGITSPAIDLTTALPAADGGTGLTSVGTSGNVLTSNGSAWASTAPTAPAALSTASGSAPSYSARSFVNFNGVSGVSILSSGNISSVTRSSAGIYVLNFTTAMPDANYSVALTALTGNNNTDTVRQILIAGVQGTGPTLKTSTQLQIIYGQANSQGGQDCANISATIFR